jgi:hypothetical protein
MLLQIGTGKLDDIGEFCLDQAMTWQCGHRNAPALLRRGVDVMDEMTRLDSANFRTQGSEDVVANHSVVKPTVFEWAEESPAAL